MVARLKKLFVTPRGPVALMVVGLVLSRVVVGLAITGLTG